MEKKNLDWSNLGFSYMKTDKRYVANYTAEAGKWDEGALIDDDKIVMSEDAGVLQYSQSVFEGLKAYTTKDGHIVCFRPDLNAQRMYDSAQRLEMPPLPVDQFVDSIHKVVEANAAWVPPFGTGATLYIRPYMFGISPVIGVKPADDYQYRVFTTPVGPYFKGGAKPIYVKISDYDRAAPHGTGNIKAGLNYAMSLHAIVTAHQEGFAENRTIIWWFRSRIPSFLPSQEEALSMWQSIILECRWMSARYTGRRSRTEHSRSAVSAARQR